MSKFGIGIFQGKKARYDTLVLEALYDNGPLTLWEISKQIRKTAKANRKVAKETEYGSTQIIQSVVSKRLRELESKTYVRKRKDKKWVLFFKGFIAFLVNETKPRLPNKAWSEIIPGIIYPKFRQLPSIVKYTSKELKIEVTTNRLKSLWGQIHDSFSDGPMLTALADTAKKLMAQGVINLDLIKNETLFYIVVDSAMPEGNFKKILGSLLEDKKQNEFKISDFM